MHFTSPCSLNREKAKVAAAVAAASAATVDAPSGLQPFTPPAAGE